VGSVVQKKDINHGQHRLHGKCNVRIHNRENREITRKNVM